MGEVGAEHVNVLILLPQSLPWPCFFVLIRDLLTPCQAEVVEDGAEGIGLGTNGHRAKR